MTARLSSAVKTKRARRWRGEIDRGPGSVDYNPSWGQLTIYRPMTRRRMRTLVQAALADPTTQSIKFWQVDE